MSDGKFKRQLKPDHAVVDLLQRTLESAQDGRITAVVVIVADRFQHVESASAGELTHIRVTNLLGGMRLAAHKLLKLLDAMPPI